ncbi:MAG: WYL domain-containing protein [Acidimicrobiales bacterium]|nr:WYL domain-containing protein [Acidimicrobiales bacterium]
MRAARLVQLLLLLQNLGPCTAARLAAELEVSVRTVYRDIEALSAAGVPLYAERGPGGGIRLVDGYQTRLTGLTGPEAEVLGLLGVPAAAAQLGLGTVIAAAQAKLDAALPAELRARSQRLRERFLLDLPGWFERGAEVPSLPALSDAVWQGRRVELRYRRRAGESPVRRRVGPLGLVLKGGRWYALCEAGRHGEQRAYRVDRVLAVTKLEDPVRRPPGFELAAAWAEAEAGFERSLLRCPVSLRLPAEELERLRPVVLDIAWRAARSSARPDPERDGWLLVDLPTESVEVAHDELLRVARYIEVLQPTSLREALLHTGRYLTERYGGQLPEV